MIRLVPLSSTTRPASHVIHVNPGLSPRKNVNPAVRVYTYNRTSSHIVDYQQLYIDLTRSQTAHSHSHQSQQPPQPPHWLFQYNAVDAYAMDEYSAAGWWDVLRRMRWSKDAVLLERYMRAVNVWKAGTGDGLDYLCDAVVLDVAANQRCKQTGVVPGLEAVDE
jgi:hypothetical protein